MSRWRLEHGGKWPKNTTHIEVADLRVDVVYFTYRGKMGKLVRDPEGQWTQTADKEWRRQ